jgi:hypothetical protein
VQKFSTADPQGHVQEPSNDLQVGADKATHLPNCMRASFDKEKDKTTHLENYHLSARHPRDNTIKKGKYCTDWSLILTLYTNGIRVPSSRRSPSYI